MHPAFSVIFLTTLIGAGQGLFLALVTGQTYSSLELLPRQDSLSFYALGSGIALALLVTGLIASFWHLGRPERAWRAVSQWRTSWLSREVLVLPAMMGLTFVYGLMHALGWDAVLYETDTGGVIPLSLAVGLLGALVAVLLYVTTAMIYASVKFLQEWASPLTVVNYTVLGLASGFTLATAFAAYTAPGLMHFYGTWAILLTVLGLLTRVASLIRNARLRHKSTVQTAIGIRHSRIQQKAQGQMGGSFNTREFFHGKPQAVFDAVKWGFLVLTFPVPLGLLGTGIVLAQPQLLVWAFMVQYLGLVAERWFFFAQANHPQNLYYQTVS